MYYTPVSLRIIFPFSMLTKQFVFKPFWYLVLICTLSISKIALHGCNKCSAGSYNNGWNVTCTSKKSVPCSPNSEKMPFKIHVKSPRGRGTLIFSYIHRLGSFFGVQNFEFQYLWGFQKNEYFLGYEDFVDTFWGSSQNWTILRGHFYAF